MAWKLVTAPATEPVTLAEAKAHLRVDLSDDDLLIESLVSAARAHIEDATGRALITQTWRLNLDNWPAADYIRLPRPPAQSVSSVVYTNSAGTAATLSSTTAYSVDTDSEPGRIVLRYGQTWPSVTLTPVNPIVITYIAGYGRAESVPQPLKQAVLLLVGHWYENREGSIVGAGVLASPIPFAIDSLIWMNRIKEF
jgi:uncharacterized phiE125 gp8 family phage protein